MSIILSWPIVGLPRKIAAGQIHVWAWHFDSCSSAPGFAASHLDLLDEEELARFHRFHFERDRTRFAIAHAYRRRILGAYLDRSPKRISFRTSLFGKPELVEEAQTHPLYFNLSHSRNVALLAVSVDTAVGVDIEDIQPIEPDVAEGHFSSAELSALTSLGPRMARGLL